MNTWVISDIEAQKKLINRKVIDNILNVQHRLSVRSAHMGET